MKFFTYLTLGVISSNPKKTRGHINLSKGDRKIFQDVEQILGGMRDLFEGLDKIGKKDYVANANGLQKYTNRLKFEFNTRLTKCGRDYFDDKMVFR